MPIHISIQFYTRNADVHFKVARVLQARLSQLPDAESGGLPLFSTGVQSVQHPDFVLQIGQSRADVEQPDRPNPGIKYIEAVEGWSYEAIEKLVLEIYQQISAEEAEKQTHRGEKPAPVKDSQPSIATDKIPVPSGLLTLYTIGHSNLTPEEFLDNLEVHGITVLVDVRSAPYSRYVPHFNKDNLKALLNEHDIQYSFAGDKLGGRPADPTVYRKGELPPSDVARSDFLKLVDYEAIMQRVWYRQAIQRLLDIVEQIAGQDGRVALMCSEGNPRDCHRHHLIARSLIDAAICVVDGTIQIKHILRDGTLEKDLDAAEFEKPPQQQSLF